MQNLENVLTTLKYTIIINCEQINIGKDRGGKKIDTLFHMSIVKYYSYALPKGVNLHYITFATNLKSNLIMSNFPKKLKIPKTILNKRFLYRHWETRYQEYEKSSYIVDLQSIIWISMYAAWQKLKHEIPLSLRLFLGHDKGSSLVWRHWLWRMWIKMGISTFMNFVVHPWIGGIG